METEMIVDAYLRGHQDGRLGRMIDLDFIRQFPLRTMSLSQFQESVTPRIPGLSITRESPTRIRRTTKYQRTYKTNFRKVQGKYKKKDGTWKKNGFQAAVREAHRLTKRTVK